MFYSLVCVQSVGSVTAPGQILHFQRATFILLSSRFNNFASRFSVIVLALHLSNAFPWVFPSS